MKPKQDREKLIKQASLLRLITSDPDGLKDLEAAFIKTISTSQHFPHGTQPFCHLIYGLDFNNVDQHNRRAYEIFGECNRRDWHLTCLMSLVCFFYRKHALLVVRENDGRFSGVSIGVKS